MPVYCKCPKCNFNGAHGFINAFPMTTKFYHTDENNKTCEWYEWADGTKFITAKDAVMAVHNAYPRYDSLWVAYMLAENPKQNKLAKLHSKRCTGGGLSEEDMVYLKKKGIEINNY